MTLDEAKDIVKDKVAYKHIRMLLTNRGCQIDLLTELSRVYLGDRVYRNMDWNDKSDVNTLMGWWRTPQGHEFWRQVHILYCKNPDHWRKIG